MIGYVTIGTTDMEKAKAFWSGLLEPLGAGLLMDLGRIAMIGSPGQPMLAVCTPFDEKPPAHGNGNMIAFAAGSREKADELYARALELGTVAETDASIVSGAGYDRGVSPLRALELGGSDEGPPGERMPGFYGGYFRDPDGNKAVFFHMG